MPEQLFSLVLDASRMCRKSHPCCKKNTLCILSNIPPCTFQVLTRAFELISPSEVGYWGKLNNLYNNVIFSTPLTAFYKISRLWEQATVTHYFPICILISKCTCYYLGWEKTVHLSPETDSLLASHLGNANRVTLICSLWKRGIHLQSDDYSAWSWKWSP